MADGYPLMNWQNPKGRGLLLKGNDVIVMSECCGAQINGHYQKDTSDWRSEVWAQCTSCGKLLEENERRWKSVLQRVQHLSGDARSGGTYWEDWGLYWFGLKNFGMRIDVDE